MKKHINRILSVVICAIVCLSFSGCGIIDSIESLLVPKGIVEDVSLGYDEIDDSMFEYSQHYTPYECRVSYNALANDRMRELYDMLYENSYYVYPKSDSNGEHKCKQVILEDSQLSEAQVRLTVKALTDDNPHIFWLSTTFGYLMHPTQNYTAVQLYSRSDPTTLSLEVSQLKEKVNSFFLALESGLSGYELEKTIHNYILSNCTYDDSLVDVQTVPADKASAFDPYGVMVTGVAVCEGYSRTFQLLCNGVGLECINIIGESEGQLHMWNAIALDGDYYYVDTTWDDKDDDAFMYDYFNISEKQLLYDHDFSPLSSQMSDEEICGEGRINALTSNFIIPQCNSTAYNYYIRECVHLSNFESDSITKALKDAADKKEKYFHFYIEPNEYNYETAVDQLFFSYPQHFFKYIDQVNDELYYYSLDKNNLSLYQKSQINVVTVMLKYV